MGTVPVYFDAGWDVDNDAHLDALRRQTPSESGRWGGIEAVDSPSEAEYHVALNRPTVGSDGELLLFTMEPPPLSECDEWDSYDSWRAFPTPRYSRPQRWTVDRTYDELVDVEAPKKTLDLSWVTSDKGLHASTGRRLLQRSLMASGYRKHAKRPLLPPSPTDGHLLRMDFYRRLESECSNILDLFGRGSFEGEHYHGEIDDKWDGLADYRYSLAIENYRGPNYWSEKVGDALLAWCMPIYWGCTNLERYLPPNSFVRIDIESEDVTERIREIVESNCRERNLNAIAEARRRILDDHQIWPVVERTVGGDEPFRTF